MSEADPILELEALLDPARLAAAWQVARDRPPAAAAADTSAAADAAAGPVRASGGTTTLPPDDAAPEDAALAREATEDVALARAAPLPVARAHRQLLDEIERTSAASPALAARARRVLSMPLAQLAALIEAVIEPIDLAAAEVALDQLEDILQALLSEAAWPESPDRPGRKEE